MKPITWYDLERWRKESIRTAKTMGFFGFPEDLQQLLAEEIALCPVEDKKPKRILFGLTLTARKEDALNYPMVWVEVYLKNLSMFLPQGLREAYNQTGMDHELLGHCGGILLSEDDTEKFACSIQRQIAK